MFTRRIVIEERAKAWVVCESCDGSGVYEHCDDCGNEGGRWNINVNACIDYHLYRTDPTEAHAHVRETGVYVTRESTLVREWGVCHECEGDCGWEDGAYTVEDPCSYCHKDENGELTGAEPDTAGEWRVE